MKHLILIAIAGAFGAMSRYGLVTFIGGKNFPWGTMTANILGSCLMGLAYVTIIERGLFPSDMKPFIMTGFLGAFTTFSAFSLEAWQLLDRGDIISGFAYIVGSVFFCLLALFVGIQIARMTL